jgi:hypothetical protein
MKTSIFTKVWLIVFCFLGQAVALAQIQKSLIGFQDIPWGTPLKQVKNKFKNLNLIDQCDSSTELKSLAKKEDRSCQILTSEYLVDGTVFDQTFIFDASQRLKRVELQHAESNHKNPSYSDDLCNQLFSRLEYLLDTRYGPSVGVSNPEPRLFWSRSEYLAWLPLPSEIFIAKSFESTHPITKRYPEHKSCEVLVSYAPRVSSQAKKL